MVRDDVTYRKEEAERSGFGFELPSEKLEVVPNAAVSTQSMSVSEVA
jgi:hypothetical protein